LPDGLWAFAYAVLITGIWIRNNSGLKYFWMSTIPVLVIGLELLQYTGMVKGTFSFQDIAFEISGLLFGIYTGIKITKSHHHKNLLRNPLWKQSLVSFIILGLFVLIATGSLQLDLLGINIQIYRDDLGNGRYKVSEYHQYKDAPKTYEGRQDRYGRWHV
jgi:hypothetical protein